MSMYYFQEKVFDNNTTYTKVLCKDGTYKNQPSRPFTIYDDECKNNGGRDTQKVINDAKKQYGDALKQQYENAIAKANENSQTQKPRTFIEMNQGYIIIAVVLVAGYFAYKKYKK